MHFLRHSIRLRVSTCDEVRLDGVGCREPAGEPRDPFTASGTLDLTFITAYTSAAAKKISLVVAKGNVIIHKLTQNHKHMTALDLQPRLSGMSCFPLVVEHC